MKATVFYFLVELPGTGMALTWMGGGLKSSKRPDRVWLCTPAGKPVLEVPRDQVHPSSPGDLARRILAERRLMKAPLN
jgi:hypothetical protein